MGVGGFFVCFTHSARSLSLIGSLPETGKGALPFE